MGSFDHEPSEPSWCSWPSGQKVGRLAVARSCDVYLFCGDSSSDADAQVALKSQSVLSRSGNRHRQGDGGDICVSVAFGLRNED